MESQDEQRMEQLQQQQLKIKEYLKTLPYEVILKQRLQAQKLSQDQQSKKHSSKSTTRMQTESEPQKQKQKNTPIQRSAKIKVKRFVKVFDDNRRKPIDPRFQQYAGVYNPDAAKKAFSFIPQLQEKQKSVLKKSLSSKKSKLSEGERQILSQRYNDVTSDIQLNKHREMEQAVNKEHRQEIGKQMKEGHTPYYKRKTIKKDDVGKRKFEGMSQYQRNKYVEGKEIRNRINFDNRKANYQRSQINKQRRQRRERE